MKTIYKMFMALNATSLMLFVYLIKSEYWIFNLGNWSIFIYTLLLLIYTRFCIAMCPCLQKASIEKKIKNISISTDGYVTTFLGLFFVALSIPTNDWKTFLQCLQCLIFFYIIHKQYILILCFVCLDIISMRYILSSVRGYI